MACGVCGNKGTSSSNRTNVEFDYKALSKTKKPTAMELLKAIVKPNNDLRAENTGDSKQP